MFSEVKYLYQPIKISFLEDALKVLLTCVFSFCALFVNNCFLNLTLQITNTQFYETTNGLEFSWAAHGDGVKLGSGILSVPVIEPQNSYGIKWKSCPWYTLLSSSSAEEIFITITAKLLYSTLWVEAGHVISSTQVQLPIKGNLAPHVASCSQLPTPMFTLTINFTDVFRSITVFGRLCVSGDQDQRWNPCY